MKISMLLCCSFILFLYFPLAGAFDGMDPHGNITINWDFETIEIDQGTYSVMVNIYNNQLYRHIESPGWRLGWTWAGNEVIWYISGAEATEQGNCSRINGKSTPHSCEKNPVIIDLPLNAPYNLQTRNCCRDGVLSSLTQDRSRSLSAFHMSVGGDQNFTEQVSIPTNFSLGIPGYTCSNMTDVKPSKFLSPDGRRYTQVKRTWRVVCTYSQFRESVSPSCCVSLSAFYSNTLVPCHTCSCGCRGSPGASKCSMGDERRSSLELAEDEGKPFLRCTNHMCPINVHWHVKENYRGYWRVKVTINNMNIVKNYSDWNLVIQHPNLQSINQAFSYKYQPLAQYGPINDTVMFWGSRTYNDMLLHYGEDGNVHSEILLQKDPETFTFKNGWAFPRRVLFDGHECVMPLPDAYPLLPNGS